MTTFILMGVSGAGKTTIGKRVAGQLDLPFLEGDDFHPPRNVARMSAGIPLTDADRVPWIDAIVTEINRRRDRNVILACSALSNFVRERLRDGLNDPVNFLFLSADPEVIAERLRHRPRHYMKPGMLPSQLAALEPPPDAKAIDVGGPLEAVTENVASYIREHLDTDPPSARPS